MRTLKENEIYLSTTHHTPSGPALIVVKSITAEKRFDRDNYSLDVIKFVFNNKTNKYRKLEDTKVWFNQTNMEPFGTLNDINLIEFSDEDTTKY
jgi:hypothetical protein